MGVQQDLTINQHTKSKTGLSKLERCLGTTCTTRMTLTFDLRE